MYRRFNGKRYGFVESFTIKAKASKKADSLRKSGKLARVTPASKHSRDYGGRYDVYVR